MNASLRLYTAFSEGNPFATGSGRRAAVIQFVVAIIAGIGMAAAFTPLLMTELHAPCAPVAVTIGLGGNAIAVTLRDNVAERIAAIIEAVFGSNKPLKGDQ